MVVTEKERKSSKKKVIPKILIYEMRYGKPIYYKDYEKVLNGELNPEAVMASTILQSWIVASIVEFLIKNLPKKYKIVTNEIGFQFAPRSWRNLDIAIFEKEKLLKEGLNNKYTKIPPQVVIEVDTKADLKKYNGEILSYIKEKTQDLLNAGVKRVVWYTTDDKKVLVAEKDKRWFITNWNDEIELIDDIKLNLEELIKEEIR
ncbi:Uma2 family endonuclease [Sulfurihydrogenibium sp.]|uniref:Uma2 family endonuclease n=1 Tax=Sulfurihydrogenibium sp. TaxID=2053621 RepID=UPI002614E1C0|nr:Uma2 family endonuclease [Sulfurihydrogenibium sp.]